MIQYFGSWLVAIAAMYPVALRLAETGGKPVDAVLSDALYLLIVLTPPRRLLAVPQGIDLRLLATIRVAAVACICYCLALSLVGYAASTEVSRIVSAVKFIKPMTFVLLGTYLAMIFPPLLLLRRMATIFALIVLATMGTAFTHPYFPRCAWGQFLFAWEIYGYPNGPMTFYGVMVPLLIAAADVEQRRTVRLFYRGTTFVAILLVISSLSRSSTIAMTVAVSFHLIATGRAHIPIFTAVLAALFGMAGVGLMRMETDVEAITFLQNAVHRRLTQTVEGDDPLSGRGGIWMLALELSANKPVFGYAFETFARYSRVYDTPHQQYLEVLFKTGIIGAALYLWMLISGIFGLWHLFRHAPPRSPAAYQVSALLGTLIGTMVGNMSQPNLSYSLLGNTLLLMLGLVLTRHGAADLVETPALVEPSDKPLSMEIRNLQPTHA